MNNNTHIHDSLIDDNVDHDYILIYKDIDNILEELNYVEQNDKLLCRSIIDSLENEAAKQLLDGKCVALPYIGNIRRSPLKMAMISHYKDFKQKRTELTKTEYKEYCKKVMTEEKRNIQNNEIKKRKLNTLKRKHLPKWIEYEKRFGATYANVWLFSITKFTVIEFDEDVEEAIQSIYK